MSASAIINLTLIPDPAAAVLIVVETVQPHATLNETTKLNYISLIVKLYLCKISKT